MEQKLPKEFKEKWVAALRSGEYEQGSGQLELNGKYCCMGVACVINNEVCGTNYFPVSINQPITTQLIKDCPDGTIGTLISMNDSSKKSFLEIAQYIEENL